MTNDVWGHRPAPAPLMDMRLELHRRIIQSIARHAAGRTGCGNGPYLDNGQFTFVVPEPDNRTHAVLAALTAHGYTAHRGEIRSDGSHVTVATDNLPSDLYDSLQQSDRNTLARVLTTPPADQWAPRHTLTETEWLDLGDVLALACETAPGRHDLDVLLRTWNAHRPRNTMPNPDHTKKMRRHLDALKATA